MAFVNLQRLMSLNADKGEEMAQQAAGDSGLEKANNAAAYSAIWHQGGLDNGAELADRVQTAQAKAKTFSGAGVGGAAKSGGNALDGALIGQSTVMKQHQAQASNLSKLMGNANAAYDAQQRQRASNNKFRGMINDADARAEEQKRAQQARIDAETKGYTNASKPWNGSYNPQTPDDYATYSNAIKNGKR